MSAQRSTINKVHRGGIPAGFVLNPGGGPLPGVSPLDLLPYKQKIRGANLVPSLAQVQAETGTAANTIYSIMWSTWDTAWITACLDSAVSLGCNTVRIQGTIYGITSGALTRAQYLARWGELSALCQARRLYLYPCGGDGGGNDQFGSVPAATVKAEIVAWATYMNTLPGIIGLDIIQENDTFAASADGLALYTAVKAVTALSCTYSFFTQPTVSGSILSDRADHVDFHIYYTASSTYFDPFFTSGAVRPLLIGETGLADGTGVSAQTAQYNQALTLLTHTASHANERLAGGLFWAIRDYDTVASNKYGALTNDGTEKTYITSVIRQWPKVDTGIVVTAPAAATVSGIPLALTSTAGTSQAALAWTAPVSNGGSAITDYTVQYRTSKPPGTWTTFAHTASTAVTNTVTGLTNGTSYDFQVAAVNSVGTGSFSASATATPGTTVVSDNFTRANGALGSTPVGAKAWATILGSSAIVSNTAVLTTAGGDSFATVNTGTATGTATVTVNGGDLGFLSLGGDATGNGEWHAGMNSGTFNVYSRGSGGAFSATIASGIAVTHGTTYRISATITAGATGTRNIQYQVNGVNVGSVYNQPNVGQFAGFSSAGSSLNFTNFAVTT